MIRMLHAVWRLQNLKEFVSSCTNFSNLLKLWGLSAQCGGSVLRVPQGQLPATPTAFVAAPAFAARPQCCSTAAPLSLPNMSAHLGQSDCRQSMIKGRPVMYDVPRQNNLPSSISGRSS